MERQYNILGNNMEEERDKFSSMVTEEPARDEEFDADEISNAASASQQESSSPNDSDLESTLKRLFPSFDDPEIKQIAQVIMLGRVFPDNFSTKIYLIVMTLAKSHRHDPKFNVILTMQVIEGLCQIGLDGKGRVEAVIVSGNTKEQAEMESKPSGF
jgi:hypothetical protein